MAKAGMKPFFDRGKVFEQVNGVYDMYVEYCAFVSGGTSSMRRMILIDRVENSWKSDMAKMLDDAPH